MKKELQDKLVDILVNIQGAASKASDFALEQLPEIAQSYVAYGRVSQSVYMALAVLMALAGIGLLVYGLRVDRRGQRAYQAALDEQEAKLASVTDTLQKLAMKRHIYRHEYPVGIPWTHSGGVSVLLGFLWAMTVANKFFLVWMAPKVWLLKEIAALVKCPVKTALTTGRTRTTGCSVHPVSGVVEGSCT